MEKFISRDEPTSSYTYEVTMLVQVMAATKDEADEKLDREGGYISYRSVLLKDAVVLYTPEEQMPE